MTEKRFFLKKKFLGKDKFHDIICHNVMDSKETEETLNILYDKYSSLRKENEKIKEYNKSQELEIVRLHKLADAMSGVLKELGVYDVYDEKQINSVKEKLNKSDNMTEKQFTNKIGINIIQNNNLPILIENEETGEMETYHMIQKIDTIYVSKMLYSHLIKRNGTIL